MPKLGLGNTLSKTGAAIPGLVSGGLVLKHKYDAGGVVPVSDGAVILNGTSEYIQTPDAFDHNNITVSAWICRTGDLSITRCIWSNRQADGEAVLFYVSTGGNQTVKIEGSNSSSGGTIDANRWYHVAFTWDGSTMKQYKDGVLVTTDSKSGTMTAGGSNARIGADAHSDRYWFSGYICNVGVWSSVLTPAQIKSIMWKNYAGLTSSETTNLVSWWNLDSTVDTAADGVTHIHDNHYGGTGAELGAELFSNPNFDDDSAWVDKNIDVDDTVALSPVQTRNGPYSLYINVDIAGEGTGAPITTVADKIYKASGWFYVVSGGAKINPSDSHFTAGTQILTTKTGEWEYISGYLKASGTGSGKQIYIQSNATTTEFYVDNVSIKEVQGNTGELKP